MESPLPEVPLFKVFSFLDVFDLLRAGQVSKYWNKVADSDRLWRNLCLKKWSFYNFPCEHLGTQTWKRFLLNQIRHEHQMELAQPEDFIYKKATGNLGILGPIAYLSGSDPPMSGQEKSVICTVSSKRMLYAWDVREGTMIWSSPVQPSSIRLLVTLPQVHLAFTVDLEGTVKVWNCQDEDALAAFTLPQACFSLEAFLTKDGPFVMVGNSEGDIYTLTVPELRNVSKVNAFNYSVDFLRCSPDKKWIFASGMHQHILPKVLFVECLLRPSEGKSPLSVSLPFSSCCRACWAPRRANRITVMFRRTSFRRTGFTTFDLIIERIGGKTVIQALQIASFLLPVHMESPIWMGVSDGNMIVFESGPYLFLFTINGLLLQQFDDHELTICNLWVDSLHVLTTSMDNYLHMYMWEEEGRYPYLKSCFHLEHIKNDYTPSWRDRRSPPPSMYSAALKTLWNQPGPALDTQQRDRIAPEPDSATWVIPWRQTDPLQMTFDFSVLLCLSFPYLRNSYPHQCDYTSTDLFFWLSPTKWEDWRQTGFEVLVCALIGFCILKMLYHWL